MFEHFYVCLDLKKKEYCAVKKINKKGINSDLRRIIDCDIRAHWTFSKEHLPHIKRVYEDVNTLYFYFKL